MRQYFTGFFTAVCITSSIFILTGSKNKNLGDITVSSITVVPGKYGGGFIQTFNDNGMETTYIGTAEDGVGIVGVHNSMGKQIAYLGAGNQGSGFLKTYNKHGVTTSYLGSGGPIIKTETKPLILEQLKMESELLVSTILQVNK